MIARREGGTCALCAETFKVGDCLWPLNGPAKKTSYAHKSCAELTPGGLVTPTCKHWLKQGACVFRDSCLFAHPEPAACHSRAPDQQAGSAAATAAVEGGAKPPRQQGARRRRPVANDSRALAFRVFLIETFGRALLEKGSGVLDVGGGNGELAFQLSNLSGLPSTVVGS